MPKFKDEIRTMLRLLLIAFVLPSLEAVDWPQRSRAHRYFWDKDDEHSNKSVPIQRRHVTSTAKTTLVSSQRTPPAEWYVISTRQPPVANREIERLFGNRYNILHQNRPSFKSAVEGASVVAQPVNACAVPYRFGPKCDGICHCSTLLACDKVTGNCKSGVCAHGYMDPPACQRPCPSGQFGFRCGFYCHCWKGVACDSVNGFCAPDGKCAEEWFGPSCQVRRLELSDAPLVTIANCENITVSWRQWISELDFGNPEIVVKNYELEVRTPSRPQWRTIYRILSDDETIRSSSKKQPLVFNYTPAPDTRFYQFRVVVNGLDSNGKYVTGVPSIPTEVFQRNCPTEDGELPLVETTIVVPSVTPFHSQPTIPHHFTSFPTQPIDVTTNGTTTATSPSSIVVSDFSVVNDPNNLNNPNNPSNVIVSWHIGPQSLAMPQDAGLLVEMIGIGNCDPFRTTDGPQIFKMSNSSTQTLRLERWRQYRITLLRSISASDVASASLARKLIITTGKVPSAAVDNIQLEHVSSRSARLSWSPLACEDRGDTNVIYECNLYRAPRISARSFDSENSTKPFFTVTTNRTWAILKQLSPAFEYLVKINAKNQYGSGPVNRIQFTTPSEEQPRPAPQIMPAAEVRPDRMTLTWSIPPASPGLLYPAVDFCELKVTPADSVVPVILERYVNCSQTNRTVENLRPNTRYLVELTQTTLDGQHSYQTMVVATPEAQPGPPLNVVFRLNNKTCTEIDWDPPNPPNGIIANYSLFLSVLDSYLPLRRQSVERYSQREPGRILCNLMLSTRYSFSVQASTSAGLGPAAEIAFWTPISPPDPPPVPFARLSDEDTSNIGETANVVVLAQPLRFSTGVITAYYLKLATLQQMKEYETIYGVSMNGTSLYVAPDSQAEAALIALPGRLVHRVLPDRFEQQQGGPLLHQAILEVPSGQMYRIVWAVSVQLEATSRLAASVSEVVRVPGQAKPTPPIYFTTPSTAIVPPITIATAVTAVPGTTLMTAASPIISPPQTPSETIKTVYNNSYIENKTDERVGWVFGIVVALIVLLVVIGIIVIFVCCCWKRFEVETSDAAKVPPPPNTVVKWNSTECVQTEDPPLNLEDWFNPTTQVDDSRYVVRGQRVLTPTRYTTSINTPR